MDCCGDLLEIGTIVPQLKDVVNEESIILLHKHNMLWVMIKSMIIQKVLSETGIEIGDAQAQDARLTCLEKYGYESLDQWPEFLKRFDRSEAYMVNKIKKYLRYKEFLAINYSSKAEARFLDRKNELDQVVYSLLRLENKFLAQELYLQIDSGESDFGDLAKKFSMGVERDTNGIVGPVSLAQAHPDLAEKLRVARPGILLEPFRVSDWWLVVRLERYSPATFTDDISHQMCHEMFKADVERQSDIDCSRVETWLNESGLIPDSGELIGIQYSL